jgi:hypothetical protein
VRAAHRSGWDPIKGGWCSPISALADTPDRRRRQRAVDGCCGPYNYDAMWGTAWMDTDIDANGNVYSREGQQIINSPAPARTRFRRRSPRI